MNAKGYVVIGKQGSGKSTHSSDVARVLGLHRICSGELVRKEMRLGTTFGQRVTALMDTGHLLPDQDVEGLVLTALDRAQKTGWILDGFPRRMSQAEMLVDRHPPTAILHLDLSDEQATTRLVHRRVCPKCQQNFHLLAHPPSVLNSCDTCGSALVQRPDDQPEAIRKRIEAFTLETLPMLPLFEGRGVPIHRVNAAAAIEDVSTEVLWRLSQYV